MFRGTMSGIQDGVASADRDRAFTLKSILFGLLGIVLISTAAGFVEHKLPSAPPLVGTHQPAGLYFYLMFIALLWALALSRVAPWLVLSTKELVVVAVMTSTACFPPTSGLFRYFQRQLILPWYYLNAGGQPAWKKFGILDYLPPKLFPQPAPVMKDGVLQLDDVVYRGFFQGLARGAHSIGLFGWPWQAWVEPLLYWGPLIILMSVCAIALSLLVHRQWAAHEQLSYPLAQVCLMFVSRKKGRGVPDVFRSRLFWWGFAPVFTLYLLEYLSQWFPTHVPGLREILPNVKRWYVPLLDKLPVLKYSDGSWALSAQNMYFSVMGLAYFVASEISLTMGLSQVLLVLAGLWFFLSTGTPLQFEDMCNARGGAYIGYALILLYTGRTYYLAVAKKAIGLGRATPDEAASVLAARLAVVSFAGFVALLIMMGLDWLMALVFALLVMLLFLVFTRIICETGIPFMQAHWWPGGLMTTLFGPAAMGPGPMVMTQHLGTILCQDPRECLMPYVATGLKMADDAKLRVTRVFWLLIGSAVVALAVGFLATTWIFYNYGGITNSGWASRSVPTVYLNDAARWISDLNDTGMLPASLARHGLAKLGLFAPAPDAIAFALAGMAAVFVFAGLRFRFTRFPLHPVLFLVWGIYATYCVWASFLVGWAIKVLVVRFGGGKVYQNLKPLFVGIIAGELIIVGFSILVELLYYWITGNVSAVRFNIMVG